MSRALVNIYARVREILRKLFNPWMQQHRNVNKCQDSIYKIFYDSWTIFHVHHFATCCCKQNNEKRNFYGKLSRKEGYSTGRMLYISTLYSCHTFITSSRCSQGKNILTTHIICRNERLPFPITRTWNESNSSWMWKKWSDEFIENLWNILTFYLFKYTAIQLCIFNPHPY